MYFQLPCPFLYSWEDEPVTTSWEYICWAAPRAQLCAHYWHLHKCRHCPARAMPVAGRPPAQEVSAACPQGLPTPVEAAQVQCWGGQQLGMVLLPRAHHTPQAGASSWCNHGPLHSPGSQHHCKIWGTATGARVVILHSCSATSSGHLVFSK